MTDEQRRQALTHLGGPRSQEALVRLSEALGDSSWRVRKEAAARLAEWQDRAASLTLLLTALADVDNVGRRNAAVEGLALMGAEAVPALLRALEGRPPHAKLAIETLGLIADQRAAQSLARFVEDTDENLRVAAAEALARIGGPVSEAALGQALGRGELLLSTAALEGLNRLHAPMDRVEIAPLLKEPMLRAAALEALARTGEDGAVATLCAALEDGARGVRQDATLALAELFGSLDAAGRRRVEDAAHAITPGGLMLLVEALLGATLGVQRAACLVLALTRRPEAARALTLALADPDVREAALDALASMGVAAVEALVTLAPELESRLRTDVYGLLPRLGPAATGTRVQELLAEALQDDDTEVALAAAEALGELGGASAMPPLLRALEREEALAQAAAQALGRLGARYYEELRVVIAARGLEGADAPYLCRVLGACARQADGPLLRGALGGSSPALRRAAADALAQLPAGDADEALAFALTDEAPEVRAAAARALGAHAYLPAIESLGHAAADADNQVRAAAARALGLLAPVAPPAERLRILAVLRQRARARDLVTSVPALEALGQLGEAADLDLLLEATESIDTETVKAAARALGCRRDPRVRDSLSRALFDRRWDVRLAAAQALGEQGPPARASLLARRAVERDPLVMEAIESALLGLDQLNPESLR